jgi:trimeric autotransporter adhesin
MANIRISQLPTASSLTGTELVPIVQNGLTSQTMVGAFSSTFTFPQTFLTIGAQASLPNSRYIAVSTGLTGTDGGIGNAYTLSLSNTGVTAGTYTFPTITVNAQGQITSASSNAGEITSISFGTTGLTPNTPTTGSVVVAGTLATTNGGTGLTSFTSGGALYATSTSALTSGTLPASAGGTGVTVSSGANSVVLRDSNQNVFANNFIPNTTVTTASATPINLTVASAQYQIVNGTVTSQTFNLPDATTLAVGDTFYFNNNLTYSSVQVNANDGSTSIVAIQAGGATHVILLSNGTTNGTWDVHSYAPSSVSWGNATLNFNSAATISGSASWNANIIGTSYGGTGTSHGVAGGGF